ncbi:hypothetical protein J8I29_21795 [Labrys sp. LIt4]|uniref:Uncharacterized protein n=1 Tax=Labrys okinawensis TaxID=346911 RepID=A0A2S9QD79_9HYPH|nr:MULTISPECIES: DUF6882 domain-containing protein [Labrys]MBP0581977.1 hypothetical protein [Labrys sp. LIt4]PRH87307.1 hypothetical protein C5L14_11805 [Labrys okinawensis]
MTTSLNDLFSAEAGSAFARQLALGDLVGDRPWSVDIGRGEIAFGSDLSFPIQVLGTCSEQDNSWLWAWANQQSDLPASVLAASLRIRDIGRQRGIGEFVEPKFMLGTVTDHMLAMLCGALLDRSCYYRASYQGGAVFLLLDNLPASIRAPVAPERVNTVLMQVVSNFELDHRIMAENFLRQQGFALKAEPAQLSATREADGAEVTLAFDAQRRIAKVEGIIKPPAAKKPWWKPW